MTRSLAEKAIFVCERRTIRPGGMKYFQIIVSWIFFLPWVGIVYLLTWLDRLIKFKLRFPRDLAELQNQQQWLFEKLQQSGAIKTEAVLTHVLIKPLSQKVVFRSNAGIVDVQYRLNGAEKWMRCFVKFSPLMGTVWNKTVFNLQLNHMKEAWFNELFANDADIPAPRCYYAAASFLTGNLCLITEFMNESKEYLEVHDTIPENDLQAAVKGLAELHALYWHNDSARMKKILAIEDSTVYLFESMVMFSWSAAARKILVESWRKMNECETVLHGDARIGNMMFPVADRHSRYVLIDWQAVRKGKAAFDLAYFLVLSLNSDQRRRDEETMMKIYLDHLLNRGVKDYSLAQLNEDYNHAALCVLVLLALPMLSGEVSVEGDAAALFVIGMDIWRERMQAKFSDFDYEWIGREYAMTPASARAAVTEMLEVIRSRCENITASTKSTMPPEELMRKWQAGEFAPDVN